MNPLGINLWNWTPSLEKVTPEMINHVSDLGFTAVELPMTYGTVPQMEEIKKAIHKNRLEVSLCASLTAGRDISSRESTIREDTKIYLKQCIDTASLLGAKTFAGPLFSGGGKRHRLSAQDKEKEWNLAVKGLVEIADYAKEKSVNLAIEPINRYRTSVVNTAGQALEMIKDINRDNVGILYDTYQACIEEESVTDALRDVLEAGKLMHFHACANHRGAPGSGHLPWEEILSLLRQYNYKEHITMETFCIGSLDECWYPLAESQDALALQGISFLKEYFNN